MYPGSDLSQRMFPWRMEQPSRNAQEEMFPGDSDRMISRFIYDSRRLIYIFKTNETFHADDNARAFVEILLRWLAYLSPDNDRYATMFKWYDRDDYRDVVVGRFRPTTLFGSDDRLLGAARELARVRDFVRYHVVLMEPRVLFSASLSPQTAGISCVTRSEPYYQPSSRGDSSVPPGDDHETGLFPMSGISGFGQTNGSGGPA